jgi:hypothetical protein
MDALSLLTSAISPDEVRGALQGIPAYEANRNRLAAVVHDGLAAYDTYQQLKPAIFAAALLGLAYTGWKFETRGRRPKNTEAMWLWGTAAAGCAATAYMTNPFAAAPVVTDPTTGAQTQTNGLVGYLDSRAATLAAEDPSFADHAFQELVAMPGIAESFQALPPVIQAVVV